MRITGLATGLDMDQIVKDSMKPYRIKIDRKGQDKEILEIKQKLYREVIKDSREFYNKYFDVTKSDSILLSKNWATTKFTSSNENVVTVTGGSDAKPGSYTITGTTAKAATQMKTELGEEIIINGQTFKVEGSSDKEKADNLNKELSKAGIKVSVRYTDFAGTVNSENTKGFIFESTVLGKDNNFVIGGTINDNKIVSGEDGKYAEITGLSISMIKNNANLNEVDKSFKATLKINDEEIIINFPEVSTNEDIKNILNKGLSEKGYSVEINDSDDIKLISSKLGKEQIEPKIEILNNDGNSESVKINFTDGEDPSSAEMILDFSYFNKFIVINGVNIDLSKVDLTDITEDKANDKRADYINKVLKEQNISIKAEVKDGNIVLKSNTTGKISNITFSAIEGGTASSGGEYANILIKNDKGGVYKLQGNSNTVTLDGVTFKFNGEIPENTAITVNGKQDVTAIKDNLVKFINDYNTLIEKLNKLTTEKRNRDFNPLTADQKKEMSEDEIKLWNEKVEKGQLSRDNDLNRISNSLKQAMRTLVDGSGLNLEKIGINPVADYQGVKNGTFTIDETKLTKALEESSEEVTNLFIKSKPKDDSISESTKYSKTGIMQRLKDILYNETVTVASSLLKKAGVEGSSTSYNNELTKSIEKYEQKMKDMEKDFARREQALYTKYANLEAIMNKYNSQQSYLMQQLGLS
ncbi:MAG: flagellar filament capping protein FliD [Clostridium sp.]|nr:flagellar filament capping protein FliD [Clostridium sp.]